MGAEFPSALALIAAVASNGVIGIDNRLPWRLPEDLKRFRALTTGHTIVMGRKTWESLPRALPDRQNIVVTRSPDYRAEGAETVSSLPDALANAARPAPVFCIGGSALYRDALLLADTMYITEIDRAFAGDTTFPPWSREHWREIARESHRLEGAGGFDYAFVTYRRIAA
jgi:dihydrofolate reductase